MGEREMGERLMTNSQVVEWRLPFSVKTLRDLVRTWEGKEDHGEERKRASSRTQILKNGGCWANDFFLKAGSGDGGSFSLKIKLPWGLRGKRSEREGAKPEAAAAVPQQLRPRHFCKKHYYGADGRPSPLATCRSPAWDISQRLGDLMWRRVWG